MGREVGSRQLAGVRNGGFAHFCGKGPAKPEESEWGSWSFLEKRDYRGLTSNGRNPAVLKWFKNVF